MTRTFTEGLAHIRDMASRRVNIGANNCKWRTREAFVVLSNGTKTASKSWAAAPDQHRDRNPSRAPAYSFGWMTGGARTLRNPRGAGHVVVNLGGGRILTPGGPADPTHWYETTAAELLRRWPNLKWVGWTRTIDGKAPALPVIHAAKPDPGPHATLLERKIYHETPYAMANSPHGDAIAAARKEWADRDFQRCLGSRRHLSWRRRRIMINTHDPKPIGEEFRLPNGAIPTQPFASLPWDVVGTLVSDGKWKIRTAHQAFMDAKAAGVPGTESELKFVPSQKMLDHLAAVAREVYGNRWPEHVEIKVGAWFGPLRWKRALKRAKRSGFKTTLIHYAGDPKTLPHQYVDHYRKP